MNEIDETTLEMIAELICGAGSGGADYSTPGPYRSMSEIYAFFGRARVDPQGLSSTRKWFALESLQAINGTHELQDLLLRLASPREYRGDMAVTEEVAQHLNTALRLEGLQITYSDLDPQLQQIRLEDSTTSLTSSLDQSPTPTTSFDVGPKLALQGAPLTVANVFLGHGRSPIWRELKDFLEDRLGLQVDEFNRITTAGVAITTRLSDMLDTAHIAFLIMTAEDEQVDGYFRARENVVHEIGLFQGRLGFEKAIVILEEGCEEFSNISGLGQIRFPAKNIRSSFEDVRQVLEREGLIAT